METSLNIPSATPEMVWALLQELTVKQAETAEQIRQTNKQTTEQIRQANKQITEKQAETAEQIRQTNKQMAEKQAETAEQIRQTNKQITEKQAETAEPIKQVNKQIGGMAYNQGRFAEEYFFNSFDQGKQNFFGEKFDDIRQNLKGTETNDEFDIVMLNGSSVGLVEVKYKAHENDLPEVLDKVNTFRTNFPKYKNHKIYLALATMAFYPKLEKECIKQGIAVIKQVGDTVVVNDEHLKVF